MFARIFLVVCATVLVWSAVARSTEAHGAKQVVTVKPSDTLWAIAERHYGGDVRGAVWRIEQANHLPGADVRVGQRLVLP